MIEFWNGLLFGLLLTILIGPVFFALIQTSIGKGLSSGISMAIGISLSDAVYIFITYFGVSRFLQDDQFSASLGISGGIMMIAFGISSFLKPVPAVLVTKMVKGRNNAFKQMAKGFMLNGINPFVLLFWLGMVSMATVNYQYGKEQVFLFFMGILTTVLTTDMIKAYLAHRIRIWVTPRSIKIMNRTVGIALIIFGLRLFYYAATGKEILM